MKRCFSSFVICFKTELYYISYVNNMSYVNSMSYVNNMS